MTTDNRDAESTENVLQEDGTDTAWCNRCGEKWVLWAHDGCPSCGSTTIQFTETDGKLSYRLLREMGLVS